MQQTQPLKSPAGVYNIFSFIEDITDLLKFTALCNSFLNLLVNKLRKVLRILLKDREIKAVRERKGGKEVESDLGS